MKFFKIIFVHMNVQNFRHIKKCLLLYTDKMHTHKRL